MLPPCGSCGAPTAQDDRFCAACGTPVVVSGTRACGSCGFPGEAADRFCRNCGAAVAAPPRQAPEPAAPVEGNGFEDILAGWDMDLPPFPTEHDGASVAVATAPPQTSPETEVLDRPAPTEPPLFDEEPEDQERSMELPLRRARAAGGFPWGATFALLGAVSVIVSAILPWDGGGTILPRDVPATVLLDPAATDGPNLGLVLLTIGTAGALVALLSMAVPATSFLRRLIGILTFAIPLAVAFRALGLDALIRPSELIAVLGVGAWAAAAGGFLQVVAGRWPLFRR